jgi:FAD/FMN-containing dehydrogenase
VPRAGSTRTPRNAELFWGIRGGGGNFGVVTSFEFQAHELGPVLLSGLVAWPLEQAPDVLRFYRDFAAAAPDELGGGVVMRLAPPAPFIPPAVHGKPIVAIVACYAGPVEEGGRVLRRLREFGLPALDAIAPKPFVAHQSMFDLDAAPGRRHYWKAHDLPGLSDAVIDVLVEHGATIPSPYTVVPVFHLGGAAGRVAEDATAYGHRDAAFAFSIDAAWEDPRDDERQIAWTRGFAAAMEPHAMGVYVNFLGNEGDERVRAAYGAGKYERLAALKAKYDPTNFFRLNQNIRPATG